MLYCLNYIPPGALGVPGAPGTLGYPVPGVDGRDGNPGPNVGPDGFPAGAYPPPGYPPIKEEI